MPAAAASKPRKKPRQERSRQMVAAILDATARVLREGGVDALSTNRVATVAGVSVGSLYQYFPNKESLLLALAEAHSQDQIGQLSVAMAEGATEGPADLVRRYVRGSIAVHKQDPQLHLAVTTALLTRGLPTALRDLEVARQLVHAYIVEHTDALDVPDPEQASWVLVTTVDMLIHAALFEGADRLDQPGFASEVVRLVLRYMGLERVAAGP